MLGDHGTGNERRDLEAGDDVGIRDGWAKTLAVLQHRYQSS